MPINIGFVGLSAAGWARVLEPAIRSLDDTYRIVAVSTTNEASASESARRLSKETNYPVKAYYGDTSKIANDPDVDFVVVAVKAPQHKKALLPVIEAKKPFFIEWPAGKSLEETKELAEAARRHGLQSMVGLQGRQSPILNRAKELIVAGKIGKMLSCSIVASTNEELLFWGPFVKSSSAYTADSALGGSLIDIALGHHIDTFLHVIGTEFTSISATTTTLYPTITLTDDDGKPTGETIPAKAPDHVAFSGMLSNGAIASVSYQGGHKSTPGRHQLLWVIDGDKGSIRVQGSDPGAAFVQIRPPKLYLDNTEVEVASEDYLIRILAAQFAEFAKGEKGTHATIEDAVKTRTLLNAIAKSGQNRVAL